MKLARAENAARRLLQQHNIVSPPVPVDELVRQLGVQLVYHEFEDDVSGLLIQEDDSSIIAANVKHHENRQRFTLAHELAHFVLHKSEAIVFVDNLSVHFRSGASSKRADLREAEANHFAACLLMPSTFLKQDLSHTQIDVSDEEAVKKLARKYRVSVQALTIRLVKLGLFTS